MSEEQAVTMAMVRDKDAASGEGRPKGRKRRKVSYLTLNKIQTVDYKELSILRRFVNERGKMIPSRQTGNTAKQQRMVARAIRRARELALLPFVLTEITADSRMSPMRRERRGPRENVESNAPREAAPQTEAAAVEAAPATE